MKWNIPTRIIDEGKKLLNDGKVINVHPDRNEPLWYAEVIDDKNYRVVLDGTGKEQDRCQCHEWHLNHYCPHTVAVELYLRKHLGTRLWQKDSYKNPLFKQQKTLPNLDELLSVKMRYQPFLGQSYKSLDLILAFEQIVIGGDKGHYFILSAPLLNENSHNISFVDWLEKLLTDQYLPISVQPPKKQVSFFKKLAHLTVGQPINQSIKQLKKYQNSVVVMPHQLDRIIDLLRMSEEEISCLHDFSFKKLSHLPLVSLVGNEITSLKIMKSFLVDTFNHVIIITENDLPTAIYSVTPELTDALKGLSIINYQIVSQQIIQFSKDELITIGEKKSSIVEAVLPLFFKIMDNIKEIKSNEKLVIDLSGRQLSTEFEVGVIFEYGQEISLPILKSHEQTSDLVIWRSDNELKFHETALSLGGMWRDNKLVFPSNTPDDRWHLVNKVIPFLRKFEFSYDQNLYDKKSVSITPVISSHQNYLSISFDTTNIEKSDVDHILQAIKSGRRYYETNTGHFLQIEKKSIEAIDDLTNNLHLSKKDLTNDTRLSMVKLPLIEQLKDKLKLSSDIKDLLHVFKSQDSANITLDSTISKFLKPYQTDGVKWLKRLNYWHLGGILADEMGLGKTIQMIALITTQYGDKSWREDHPVMIICPASLVDNWLNEFKRFSPDITTIRYRGTKNDRQQLLDDIPNKSVFIMSYGTFIQDSDDLINLPWASLVLDEAQYVKNYRSKTHKILEHFTFVPIYALSGTPLENNLVEYWSIMSLVAPDLFPSLAHFQHLSVQTIKRLSAPFFLRREKKEVLENLPGLIEVDCLLDLCPEQKKLYLAQLESIREEISQYGETEINQNRFNILAGLTRLRQICCHPGLVTQEWKMGSVKYNEILHLLMKHPTEQWLIFSQFASGLPHLAEFLKQKGYSTFLLDGKTPIEVRQKMVNRFNRGERPIFLISLKAGGTGLNLSAASRVILLDLWWNPAVEEQAAARAHRIGQSRNVTAYRLIAKGTIETKIRSLQNHKRELVAEVVKDSSRVQSLSKSLTPDELKQLFF